MHIGMILNNRLNFESHIAKKIAKANQGLGILKQLKNGWLTAYSIKFTKCIRDLT